MNVRVCVWIVAVWACWSISSACSNDSSAQEAEPDAGADVADREDTSPDVFDAADSNEDDGASEDTDADTVVTFTCDAARDSDGNATPIRVTLPGKWRMEACDVSVVFEFDFAFGEKAGVQITPATNLDNYGSNVRGISGEGDDLGLFRGGSSSYVFSPPNEETRMVQLTVFGLEGVAFAIELQFAECTPNLGCDQGQYCAPPEWVCFDCDDGNDLFSRDGDRLSNAPSPLKLNGELHGFLCIEDEDWYVIALAAGESIRLSGPPAAAYEADESAISLNDLVRVDEHPFGIDEDSSDMERLEEFVMYLRGEDYTEPTDMWISPRDRAREVWVRVDPNIGKTVYTLTTKGGQGYCNKDAHCLAETHCINEACTSCTGSPDPNDNITVSPDAVPTPIAAGDTREGSLCGADVDWFALAFDQPEGSQQITRIDVRSQAPIGMGLLEPSNSEPVDGIFLSDESREISLSLRGITGTGTFWIAIVGGGGEAVPYTIDVSLEER